MVGLLNAINNGTVFLIERDTVYWFDAKAVTKVIVYAHVVFETIKIYNPLFLIMVPVEPIRPA